MTRHLELEAAKIEIKSAQERHKKMLVDVRFHSIENNTQKSEFLFLMAVPLIYAAWEGYFRLVCSICLKRQCYVGQKAGEYNEKYATLWLQKEGFFDSFLQKLLNSMQLGKPSKRVGSGKFRALSEFADSMKKWLNSPINHLSNFDEMVMTYSNVNKEVVHINSEIIGLDLSGVDFSKIDELLNRRNEIAHGGLIDYPRENSVVELLDYTDNLINTFHSSVEEWLLKS